MVTSKVRLSSGHHLRNHHSLLVIYIRKAIPPHCFNLSLLQSSFHLFIDLFISFSLYYVAAIYVAWPVYWILQGSIQMGIWMLGHECAHQGFCDYHWLNDTVGYFLHASLLTPYFSFKYSHGRHHAQTASLENETSFVPREKSSLNQFDKFMNTPLGRLIRLVILCTIGWVLYICFNVAGHKYDKFANHFDPKSPIFNDSERFQILVTDIGLLVTCYGLYKLALAQGFTWLVMIYFAPLVVLYAYVTVITWLNHTHSSLPHYDSIEWNWLKGGLSTMDRDYGILNTVFHHITDAHVVHHLFPTIAHYHAIEATKAIKPILGEYYHFDDTSVINAMWREATECFYVEADEGSSKKKGVYWFNNKL